MSSAHPRNLQTYYWMFRALSKLHSPPFFHMPLIHKIALTCRVQVFHSIRAWFFYGMTKACLFPSFFDFLILGTHQLVFRLEDDQGACKAPYSNRSVDLKNWFLRNYLIINALILIKN